MQFVFFLGKAGDGDGPQAGATINAPTPGGAQVAACWGADLQRVLWDAVLDAVEVCIHRAGTQLPNQKMTLQGFYCTNEAICAQVLVGDI